MRLIDAEDIPYTMLYKENWMKGTGEEAQGAWKSDIDKMPTIDAIPVVHGKWLPYEFCTDGTWDKCSVCGVAHRTRSKYTGYIDGKEHTIQDRMNYCPICGAKMDGGEDDEEQV